MTGRNYQQRDPFGIKGSLESTESPPEMRSNVATSSPVESLPSTAYSEFTTSDTSGLAQSMPALFDKYIMSRRNWYWALAVFSCFAMFVYDSMLSEMSSWSDIWWSCQKMSVPLGLAFVVHSVIWLRSKMGELFLFLRRYFHK